MDSLQILNLVITSLAGIILWFMRSSYTDLKTKQETLSKEVSEVRMQYLHKEEFKEFKREFEIRLDRYHASFEAFRDEFHEHERKELELQNEILQELRRR